MAAEGMLLGLWATRPAEMAEYGQAGKASSKA